MNKIESLLHHALTPTEGDAPDPRINQKILQSYQEEYDMKHSIYKKTAIAILSAVIVVSGSLTAVAAWHYLTPAQVAEEMEDAPLARAFQGKDAVSIQETQSYGNYKITLEGMVSGKNISSYVPEVEDEVQDGNTYIVLSIGRTDGTSMPVPSDDAYTKEPFMVSPFLQGQPIRKVNIFTMSGGCATATKDGIMYKIIDCDNLEPFADKEVYLGVTDTDHLDSSAYEMNTETGRITRSESYAGVNALFTLPLDRDQADTKKADALLKEWLEPTPDDTAENDPDDTQEGFPDDSTEESPDNDIPDYILKRPTHLVSQWSVEKIKKRCTYVKESTKNLKPDAEGMIHFYYKDDKLGIEGDNYANVDYYFKHNKPGHSEVTHASGSDERVYVQITTKEKDGTYTVRLYYIDLPL